MVRNMKTTVDIADRLLQDAREVAAREGVTLKSLVEEGLHAVLAARRGRAAFRLESASFRGNGLQPGVRVEDGAAVRGLIYRGRGG